MENRRIASSDAYIGFSAPVQIQAAAADSGKKPSFTMNIYNGGEMNVAYWGRTVVDLPGVIAKDRIPILVSHDRYNVDSIAGYSTKVTIGADGIEIEGVLSNATDGGVKVALLAADGFPWQASMGLAPTKIEEVDEGASAEANGKTWEGPVTIIRAGNLNEGSFVPLGADSSTSVKIAAGDGAGELDVQVLSAARKETDMTDKNEQTPAPAAEPAIAPVAVTLDSLKASQPELCNQLVAEGKKSGIDEGIKAERERIAEIHAAAFTGQDELVAELVSEGVSVVDAVKRINAAAKEQLGTSLEELKAGAAPAVGQPASDLDQSTEGAQPEVDQVKAELLKKWDDSPSLRKQFGVDASATAADAEDRKRIYMASEGYVETPAKAADGK